MKKGYRQLVDEAMAEIETLATADAIARHAAGNAILIDLRESGELRREGRIPGAVHVPRGMLEFWIDPESPYFKPALAGPVPFILFCGAGWRSALAARALQDMGIDQVSHIGGGFDAWRAAGGPVEHVESAQRSAK